MEQASSTTTGEGAEIPLNPPFPKGEVLVLGAGLAGLAAAIEAAARGATVTVLDKLGPTASTRREEIFRSEAIFNDTARAGGGGLDRFSLEAPVDELLRRHREMGWGRVDTVLLRTYLERVADDCRWLRDSLGLPYEGNRVKGRGAAICPFLYRACRERGVRLLFRHKSLKLLTDGGAVTGARVRNEHGEADFQARAVILATGSFQGNQEMMLNYVGPDITYLPLITGSLYNTGNGLAMARNVGGQLVNLTVCHIRTTDRFFGEGPSRFMTGIYPMGIYLNQHCQRFIDEGTADSDVIANAIFYQPGSQATLIFDEKARARYPKEYENYPHRDEVIQAANELDGLARKCGLSPEGVQKAIGEFNTAVTDGKAGSLAIPKTQHAFKIDTPPYYAFSPVLPGLNHPIGGLKIDARARVLDLEREPIPGLYAAGSIVNWAFGKPYELGGVTTYKGSYHAGGTSGLAIALVFGRIAGENAGLLSLDGRGLS
ncbi:MAG: FAD-dependent oxidoreductase [Chloroflexi bacterium]|nr:FAD-dependent oxidoreductase [Chloroflexota bacterium]